MRTMLFLVVIAVAVVGGIAAIVVGIPVVTAMTGSAPQQPIDFSHVVHVKAVQVECQFCHRSASTAAIAGVPAEEQCMFCHRVVGTGRPEVEKLRTAFANQEPIDWVRVHRMPDHVRFIHEPHISAGFACSTCHGQVEEMARVRQVRALNMGDCLACHRQNNAATDCATCHQ